jgi:hypothetical protein
MNFDEPLHASHRSRPRRRSDTHERAATQNETLANSYHLRGNDQRASGLRAKANAAGQPRVGSEQGQQRATSPRYRGPGVASQTRRRADLLANLFGIRTT